MTKTLSGWTHMKIDPGILFSDLFFFRRHFSGKRAQIQAVKEWAVFRPG